MCMLSRSCSRREHNHSGTLICPHTGCLVYMIEGSQLHNWHWNPINCQALSFHSHVIWVLEPQEQHGDMLCCVLFFDIWVFGHNRSESVEILDLETQERLCGSENINRTPIEIRVSSKRVKSQLWVNYPFNIKYNERTGKSILLHPMKMSEICISLS